MIGQLAVGEKTNEIPKLPELPAPPPIAGAVGNHVRRLRFVARCRIIREIPA